MTHDEIEKTIVAIADIVNMTGAAGVEIEWTNDEPMVSFYPRGVPRSRYVSLHSTLTRRFAVSVVIDNHVVMDAMAQTSDVSEVPALLMRAFAAVAGQKLSANRRRASRRRTSRRRTSR